MFILFGTTTLYRGVMGILGGQTDGHDPTVYQDRALHSSLVVLTRTYFTQNCEPILAL